MHRAMWMTTGPWFAFPVNPQTIQSSTVSESIHAGFPKPEHLKKHLTIWRLKAKQKTSKFWMAEERALHVKRMEILLSGRKPRSMIPRVGSRARTITNTCDCAVEKNPKTSKEDTPEKTLSTQQRLWGVEERKMSRADGVFDNNFWRLVSEVFSCPMYADGWKGRLAFEKCITYTRSTQGRRNGTRPVYPLCGVKAESSVWTASAHKPDLALNAIALEGSQKHKYFQVDSVEIYALGNLPLLLEITLTRFPPCPHGPWHGK